MNESDSTSLEALHEGMLVLHEPAGGGLACTLMGCDNPKCMCREVHLHAISFGPWVQDVKLEQGELRFVVDDTQPEAADLGIPIDLRLDVDQGSLMDDDGEPFDIEAHPRLEILEQAMDAPFLDEMARQLLRRKGLRVDEGARQPNLDLNRWKPGEHIFWTEVFQKVRQDLYRSSVADIYLADDIYCPDPKCECHDVGVVFFGDENEEGEGKEAGLVRVDLESGEVRFEPEVGCENLLQTLWRSFHQRHHGIEHLKRREIEMKKFGAEVLFNRPDSVRREQTSVRREQPKVGRNESCPCGSGKKYKKCCLRKSA